MLALPGHFHANFGVKGLQNYKDLDGILYAAKITIKRDGRDCIVEEIAECELAEKLDESLLVRPKKKNK